MMHEPDEDYVTAISAGCIIVITFYLLTALLGN